MPVKWTIEEIGLYEQTGENRTFGISHYVPDTYVACAALPPLVAWVSSLIIRTYVRWPAPAGGWPVREFGSVAGGRLTLAEQLILTLVLMPPTLGTLGDDLRWSFFVGLAPLMGESSRDQKRDCQNHL